MSPTEILVTLAVIGSTVGLQLGKMSPTIWSLVTICGDECLLSCVSAEACLTGWPNAQGRRDGEVMLRCSH